MLFTDLKCYHLFQILQKALVLNKAHRFPLEADRWGFLLILLLFHMTLTENTVTAPCFQKWAI